MEGKMAAINNLIHEEETAQNVALAEQLARRKAKKDKLKTVINNLAAQKDASIDSLGSTLAEVKQQEKADIAKIDKEIEDARKKESK